MKKIIASLTAFALICMSTLTAFASTPSDYSKENIAVVASDLVYMHSTMTINGSVYTTGEIRFDGTGKSNCVNGSVISPTENGYTQKDSNGNALSQWASKPSISGEAKTDKNATYTEKVVDPLFTVPTLSGAVNGGKVEVNEYWGNGSTILHKLTIDSDRTYQELTITGKALTIDLSKNDVTLVVDKLNMLNNQSTITLVNTQGNQHKFYLYVKDFQASNGNINVNQSEIGDTNRANVYINGDVSFGTNSVIAANIFVNGSSVTVNGSEKIYGNLVTNASKVTLTGNVSFYGVVYAPLASSSVVSSALLNGQLVTKSLDMSGNSKISYDASAIKNFETNVKDSIYAGSPEEKPINTDDVYKNDLIPSNEVTTDNIVGKLTNEVAYLYGKSDTIVAPNDAIIRCEASALLYRLLKQNDQLSGYAKPSASSFSDLNTELWYNNGLEFMTQLGVYNKNGNSAYINAYQEITRGEAAKLFAFALGLKSTNNACHFSDLDTSNRYYKYINALVANGYMSGDAGKNTIRPNDSITRAEFVVIYNLIIGRGDQYDIQTDVEGNPVVCPFTDIQPSDWYYNDLMRATNAFTNKKVDLQKRADRNDLDD